MFVREGKGRKQRIVPISKRAVDGAPSSRSTATTATERRVVELGKAVDVNVVLAG